MQTGSPNCRTGQGVAKRWVVGLALVGSVTPSALGAQACVGFSGTGFVSGSGAVCREGSDDTRGIGGAAGLDLGPVAATGRFLKFSGADEFNQDFDFEDARANVALKLPIPLLSVCPVVTVGTGGVLSRNFSDLPYKSETIYGGGVAVGKAVQRTGLRLRAHSFADRERRELRGGSALRRYRGRGPGSQRRDPGRHHG